mgnify:CR=1 FL=1
MNEYKDLPIGFHRVTSTPLDRSSVLYGSVIDILQYANGGTVYNGQKIVVEYPNHYHETITFVKVDDEIVPKFDLPNGYEFITLKYDGDEYVMVYYYNKGLPFSSKDQVIRFTDPSAWCMLPQISLLTGTIDNIDYLLEVNKNIYLFNQDNFVLNPLHEFIHSDFVNGIYDIENDKSFYVSNNMTAYIMPKEYDSTQCVKLYVKANKFVKTLM